MKWANYIIGLIGLTCFIASICITYFHQDKVKAKNGIIYYTHDMQDKGYGLAIQRHDPQQDFSEELTEDTYGLTEGLTSKRHRCAVFKGEVTNADFSYPFHPIVIDVDNDLVVMHVSFPNQNNDHVVLSVSNNLETSLGGYLVCNKTLLDRKESYIDLDGDFLPDKRVTYFKHPYPSSGKRKNEVIRYSYEEEIEQAAPSNR